MKAFNKQRFNLINMKGVKKYVLYAIGEIILVVLGILIAVNINNANENRKANKELDTILNIYRQDVITDTTLIHQNFQILNLKKEAFKLFLSDTVALVNYKQNPIGYSLTMTHRPFELQDRGYKLLVNQTDDSSIGTDSLVIQIIASYPSYKNLLEQAQERINRDLDDNLLYLKNNKPWFSDLLQNKLTPEVDDYFLSKEYKNRLAYHHTLVVGNWMRFLEIYQKSAKDLLEQLNKRLD